MTGNTVVCAEQAMRCLTAVRSQGTCYDLRTNRYVQALEVALEAKPSIGGTVDPVLEATARAALSPTPSLRMMDQAPRTGSLEMAVLEGWHVGEANALGDSGPKVFVRQHLTMW